MKALSTRRRCVPIKLSMTKLKNTTLHSFRVAQYFILMSRYTLLTRLAAYLTMRHAKYELHTIHISISDLRLNQAGILGSKKAAAAVSVL